MNTDKVSKNPYEQRHKYFVIVISEPAGGSPNEDCSVADAEGCTEGIDAFFPFGFESTFFLEAGKMIVFNMKCLEIATKTVLFKSFQAGLDGEFQIAMLSNLVSFLMCKSDFPVKPV